jgi:hypothetical protein
MRQQLQRLEKSLCTADHMTMELVDHPQHAVDFDALLVREGAKPTVAGQQNAAGAALR